MLEMFLVCMRIIDISLKKKNYNKDKSHHCQNNFFSFYIWTLFGGVLTNVKTLPNIFKSKKYMSM